MDCVKCDEREWQQRNEKKRRKKKQSNTPSCLEQIHQRKRRGKKTITKLNDDEDEKENANISLGICCRRYTQTHTQKPSKCDARKGRLGPTYASRATTTTSKQTILIFWCKLQRFSEKREIEREREFKRARESVVAVWFLLNARVAHIRHDFSPFPSSVAPKLMQSFDKSVPHT